MPKPLINKDLGGTARTNSSVDKGHAVVIAGRIQYIAPDDRQPGGDKRSKKAYDVVGSVIRGAEEVRRRNIELKD